MIRIKCLFMIFLALFLYSHSTKADVFNNTSTIDTLMDVELNGLSQKILITSNDFNNPILLWLHGGPGTSEMFINHHCMSKLLDYFTIIHWDQRGTALSYTDSIKNTEISFNKIMDDAFTLTEILKKRYNQNKIFLIGHSFGSVLGIHLIEKYPENYYAYVGMGQVIDSNKSREITLKWFANKLKEENDTSELKSILENQSVPRSIIDKYHGIFYKEQRLLDIIKKSPHYYDGYIDTYLESMRFVRECIVKNPSTYEKNIYSEIRKLKVPVYFFEGRHDRIAACAPELVVEYSMFLEAPKNEVIWFEESAHHPNIDEPDKFQRIFIDKVLKENYNRN